MSSLEEEIDAVRKTAEQEFLNHRQNNIFKYINERKGQEKSQIEEDSAPTKKEVKDSVSKRY